MPEAYVDFLCYPRRSSCVRLAIEFRRGRGRSSPWGLSRYGNGFTSDPETRWEVLRAEVRGQPRRVYLAPTARVITVSPGRSRPAGSERVNPGHFFAACWSACIFVAVKKSVGRPVICRERGATAQTKESFFCPNRAFRRNDKSYQSSSRTSFLWKENSGKARKYALSACKINY